MVSSLPSLPSVPGTDPSSCILDAFRTAIAKRVSDALPPLTLEQAYTGVDYGKKGVDFTIALPRFRLPGKPDELAKKVLTNVSRSKYAAFDDTLLTLSSSATSSNPMTSSRQSRTTSNSCISNSTPLPSSERSSIKYILSLMIAPLASHRTAQTPLARVRDSSSSTRRLISPSHSTSATFEVRSSARS